MQTNRLFDRELSWLEFNARVLAEGMDASNPLLERLKFLGIVSSNLDEFFMVRVASLAQDDPVLPEIYAKASALAATQNEYFLKTMLPELESAGLVRVAIHALNDKQKEYLNHLFHKEIFPVLTPIAIHEDKPMPPLINLSLYLICRLSPIQLGPVGDQDRAWTVVEVPKNFPRMISLPSEQGSAFIFLEDVILLFAKKLFTGYEIIDHGFFRLTRAAEMTLDEENDEDFAQIMTEALRHRQQSAVVRLEASVSDAMRDFLVRRLGIRQTAVFPVKGWFDFKSISQLAFLPGFEPFKRPPWNARPVPDFEDAETVWQVLKKKDVWIHHPYDSFSPVVRFISEAADDPDVLAIKQTLYRVGQDSLIAAALERAAQKGKRVTVLVELKARFDEEKNIEWARRLEIAGASVLYGIARYKTHAKACLVVRREPEGIKRYLHLSTGNYNEKTAQLYSDIGFFTSREDFANDLSTFFNMITGCSQPMALSKMDVAPYGLRRKLTRLILRESLRSSKEHPGLIMAKMNSLVDPEIIETLYRASQSGVQIKLNVRGVCCLRPGVKDLSENIEVVSIVDMFLEHSRMFCFSNGGNEEIYLSSADWMPRSFDRRIELMFPVEDKEIKKDLTDLLKSYFKDNIKSWRLLPEGEYIKIDAGSSKKFRAQEYLCRKTAEREEAWLKTPPKELRVQKPKHEETIPS